MASTAVLPSLTLATLASLATAVLYQCIGSSAPRSFFYLQYLKIGRQL